jgi:hypothetical protein
MVSIKCLIAGMGKKFRAISRLIPRYSKAGPSLIRTGAKGQYTPPYSRVIIMNLFAIMVD